MRKILSITIGIIIGAIAGTGDLQAACKGGRKSKAAIEQTQDVARGQQFTYYWYAARHYLDRGEVAKALMTLHLCEQLNPQDAMTQAYLAAIYEMSGDPNRARGCYRRAYLLDPAEQWFGYLRALYQTKDAQYYKEILSISKEATRLNPKEISAWEQLQQAAVVNGEYRLALSAQDKIDALEGYSGMSALNRYRIHLMEGKPRKALDDINRYIEQDPNNLQFLLFRVELLEAISATPERIMQEYVHILRLDPGNPMVLNNYAYLLATNGGDLRQAERMSQQSLREQPENPVFLDTYAWILYLQGEKTLAAFYIRKALNNAGERERGEIEAHYKAIIQ